MLLSKTNQFRAQAFRKDVLSRAQEIYQLDGSKHDLDPAVDSVQIEGKKFSLGGSPVWTSGTVAFADGGRPTSMEITDRNQYARRDRYHDRAEVTVTSLRNEGGKAIISESLEGLMFARNATVTYNSKSLEITGFEQYMD